MPKTTIIARRKMGRTIRRAPAEYEWANGLYLLAEAKLTHLEGNERPHFSVTGEIWDSRGWAERGGPDGRLRASGALGKLVASQFPRLAAVNALHLADDDGAPMHAEANGWYWYSDYDGKGADLYPSNEPMYSMTPHERAAHHLRIPADELPRDLERTDFGAFVESLRPRWKEDAAFARSILTQS